MDGYPLSESDLPVYSTTRPAPPLHKTVGEWGLFRKEGREWISPYVGAMRGLLAGVVHPETSLIKYRVCRHSTERNGKDEICHYAIPNELGNVYITILANLDIIKHSRMKLRDMIIDNCKVAGLDLTKLDALGIHVITNKDALASIKKAYYVQNIRYRGPGVSQAKLVNPMKTTPTGKGWDELIENNPLIQGQIKMLEEYKEELGDAKIDKVVVMTIETHYNRRGTLMVTHLKRE